MSEYAILGLLSGILQIFSGVPYLLSILRRETKPNIVSQFLWTVLQIIALTAQLQGGWSWSALILVATTCNTIVFTFLCFRGYGYKGYGWIDYSCFAGALVALTLWYVTADPLWALIIAVGTSVMASVPTIVKVIKYPDTENATAWLIMSVASVLSFLSVSERSIGNLIVPIQYFLESSIIGWIALIKGYPILKQKKV